MDASEQERAKTAEEAQRWAAHAAFVYRVGQRLSGELELEPLFSEIVTAIYDAFDYYGVMLMLADEERCCLSLQAIAGGYVGTFPQDLQFVFGQGMIGRAAESGEIQISGDVTQNPHFVQAAEEETQSELSVPIKSGQRVIGIALYNEKNNEMDFRFHVDEGIQHPRKVRPLSGFSRF